MSTGDAEVLAGGAKKRGEALLDILTEMDPRDDRLADSIEKALRKLAEVSSDQKKGVSVSAHHEDVRLMIFVFDRDIASGSAKERFMHPHLMRKFLIWLGLEIWMLGVHGGWLDDHLIW
jgi:hypothetical protein